MPEYPMRSRRPVFAARSGRRAVLFGLPAFFSVPALAGDDAFGRILDYERSSGGRIGFYAQNTFSRAELAWRPHERFVMCSTVKASLAAYVFALSDRRQLSLDEIIRYTARDIGDFYAPVARQKLPQGAMSIRELCAGAVEMSDNTCCNLLLRRVGGPAALTRFWRSIGDDVSRIEHTEPLLNRTPPGGMADTTTPAAMAATLRTLLLGNVLSETARNEFKALLIGCTTGANRLRAGLPSHWVTGDKTGNNGKDAA